MRKSTGHSIIVLIILVMPRHSFLHVLLNCLAPVWVTPGLLYQSVNYLTSVCQSVAQVILRISFSHLRVIALSPNAQMEQVVDDQPRSHSPQDIRDLIHCRRLRNLHNRT